jgi:hypothetical protein
MSSCTHARWAAGNIFRVSRCRLAADETMDYYFYDALVTRLDFLNLGFLTLGEIPRGSPAQNNKCVKYFFPFLFSFLDIPCGYRHERAGVVEGN